MLPGWDPLGFSLDSSPIFFGFKLEKGEAHVINFHLARAAQDSLILSPFHDGELAAMFSEVLGVYPQPPFPLHSPSRDELKVAFDSIRSLMSTVDHINYSSWLPFELEPFPKTHSKHVNTI